MGLDMHLKAEKYVSGYDHASEVERSCYMDILATVGLSDLAKEVAHISPGLTVSATVAYWRKANAIHAWFVDNVQDGKDECQTSYVSLDALKALRDTTIDASAQFRAGHKSAAAKLLPPRQGFFFGGTDLDEWYLHHLDDTVRQLTPLIEAGDSQWSYYYQASW